MDLEQKAIERLKHGELISHRYYHKPLQVCYSGGKDSDVLVELALRAGIDFEVVNSHTTADAPDTVYYIRKRFKELEEKGVKCTIQYPMYKGQRTSMWSLIPQQKMPPTRVARYCCEVLKENSGKNRTIATGVRWDEGTKRKSRGALEAMNKNKEKRIVLMDDNTEDRRFIERCEMKSKISINPIVEWLEDDVWDYLDDCKCEANPLYRQGFGRVGCVGCPMAGKRRWGEFKQFPQYQKMYIKAFDRMLFNHPDAKNGKSQWKNGKDVFLWWMEENPNQLVFDEFELK